MCYIFYFKVVAGTLDLYGNESDCFLILLRPYLTSTITTTCCLKTCPLQVNSVLSMPVTLSQPSKLTTSIFLDALEDCQHPPDSQCGRQFSHKPAEEIPFNEDVTFDEHGHADTSRNCAGVRVSSHRVMLNISRFFS